MDDAAREARLEQNRRKQAAEIERRLQMEENRRVRELLTWWANNRKEKNA